MSESTPSATQIGKHLVEMCNTGREKEFVEQYYSREIVSVEVVGMPEAGMPREMKGIDAIKQKGQWWYDNHEVHSWSATGPFPNGEQFLVFFEMDITSKTGPMAGQRMQMQEAGLYTVKDGKIVHEQFFYDMGEN
ncbi:MAG: nuclear transport factor 2 family protein [Planctomycetota bacterium]